MIVPPFQRNQTASDFLFLFTHNLEIQLPSEKFPAPWGRHHLQAVSSLFFIHLFLVQPLNHCWKSLANCSFSAMFQQTVFVWKAHPRLSLKLFGIDGFSQTPSQLAQALQELAMWLVPIKPYICCINTTVPIWPELTVFFMFIFSGSPCLVWQLTGLLLDLLYFLNAPIFLSHYDITFL